MAEQEKSGTELFRDLQTAVEASKENAIKVFEKGNKSAGGRFRKELKTISDTVKELRNLSLK